MGSFKFEMKLKQIQVTPQYEMEKSRFEACLKHSRDTEQIHKTKKKQLITKNK